MDELMNNDPAQKETPPKKKDIEENKVFQMLRDIASEEILNLQNILTEQKNSKTRVKRQYLEKKADLSRDKAIGYMLEMDKIRARYEAPEVVDEPQDIDKDERV